MGKDFTNTSVGSTMAMGVALAMILSYHNANAIYIIIIHGVLNWLYVIYYLFNYGWYLGV
jgi:hypothetical protein